MTTPGAAWIGAADACRLLAVTRATLYAYVSRGYVRSQAAAGQRRTRLYAREDVERLRRRTEERRAPDKAAARALTWGMPVLESSITLIDGRAIYYRGQDAAALAASHSLEAVATLLWAGPSAGDAPPRARDRSAAPPRHLPFVARAQCLLAAAAARDPRALDRRPAAASAAGFAILHLLLRAAGAGVGSRAPAHAALARLWKVDGRGAEVIRGALVLCADHELNVSCFAARCVASAGAHLYAAVIAGLAAIEGPKHGGAAVRVEAMLEAMRRARPLSAAVAARLRRGEPIDGFGHPLYAEGDPRARVLLALLRERYAGSAEYRFVAAFADAVTAATGERPNVDFALAAAARVLRLPAGSPLVLFAIARSVGWIAHAIEQHATEQLIRPRAKYVGVCPPAG